MEYGYLLERQIPVIVTVNTVDDMFQVQGLFISLLNPYEMHNENKINSTV